jgi:aldose 1-epimerase
MAARTNYYWKKETDRKNNLEFYILGYHDPACAEKNMEAWVLPALGANLCRFSYGGHNIIDFDAALWAKNDFTGTPVLYPTPNRVRNGVYTYLGRKYIQEKRGAMIYEHGLVHNEHWNFHEPVVKSESVTMQTWIDFNPTSAVFEAFPFEHRLGLEFKLTKKGIQVSYSIENKGEKVIPYGFGLHPYFQKLSGDENTTVMLPARNVMDTTSDMLPTGRLIDVEGTIYDLRRKKRLGKLDLDHVFTGLEEGKHAIIDYRTLGMVVERVTSDDFTHLVLYCPRGSSYFCLENQTCSTDVHNMAARGFLQEAGLKYVQAGETHRGSVSYQIKKGIKK